MTTEQYLQRAQLCHAMAHSPRAPALRREHMLRASWLWLLAWAGMFA